LFGIAICKQAGLFLIVGIHKLPYLNGINDDKERQDKRERDKQDRGAYKVAHKK